jgi:hypothetical protein
MTNDAKHPVIPEMKPYGRYELAVKLFDGEMNAIDSFPVRQDLWASDDAFVVRITRDKGGSKTQYEDRGKVGSHGEISGLTGFGGQLAGQLLKNNGVFLHELEENLISLWLRRRLLPTTTVASGASR